MPSFEKDPLYDYESAEKYGIKPGEDKHWQSRVPQTGLILKSENHPTFYKTLEGEAEAGMSMYRNTKDKRLYSFPKDQKVGEGFTPYKGRKVRPADSNKNLRFIENK